MEGPPPSLENPLGNPDFPGSTSAIGPNWLGWLLKRAPKNTLNYNFAVGGATSDGSVTFPGGHNPFSVQVDDFMPVARHGEHFAPWTGNNSIFIVWFGVNDVDLTVTQAKPELEIVDFLIGKYFDSVDKLRVVGARRFLFLGVPRKHFSFPAPKILLRLMSMQHYGDCQSILTRT